MRLGDDGACEWMFTLHFRSSCPTQELLMRPTIVDHFDLIKGWSTSGDRSRLIENHRSNLRGSLQRCCSTDKNAAATRFASPHHHRKRRCNSKRTWARNDQHGDCRDDRDIQGRHRPPREKCCQCNNQDRRNENAANTICISLDWRLRDLGFINQLCNSPQRRCAAACNDSDNQAPIECNRPRRNRIADLSQNRKRFARQRTFID